jgi:hypothetical protein
LKIKTISEALDCEPEYEFEVISIVTSLKDYRLCWLLNKHLRLDFFRMDDLAVPLPRKKKNGYFTRYAFNDEVEKMNYALLANKSEGNLLLPELKTVDYILKMEGYLKEEKKEQFMETLKQAPFLEAVFGNALSELKSKDNLLF